MPKHISFTRNRLNKLVEQVPENKLDDACYLISLLIEEIEEEPDPHTPQEMVNQFVDSLVSNFNIRNKIYDELKKK